MIYEHRKVRTKHFGNEEEAKAAVHSLIPNATIINTKRIAQIGMNPLFIFDLEVMVTADETVQPDREDKDDD